LGCLFLAFTVQGSWRAIKTYGWEKTTCRILDSRVTRADGGTGNYEFQPRYSYSAGGGEREGTVYKPGYSGSDKVSDASALASRYEKGAKVPCFVSGSDPGDAALERPSLWMLLMILLPLVFVAVGSGGLMFAWSPKGDPKKDDPSKRALSTKAVSPGKTAGCLAAFFSVFLFVGLATSLFFVLPALKVLKAQSWREVPCTVVESSVRSHPGSDSTTYSVDILYEYEAGGRTRRSNRWEFLGGSSGGASAKQEIVAANPPGTRRSCHVNPEDPDDVVMHRGLSKAYWIVLVPFLFAAAGFGGILYAFRIRKGTARKPGDPVPAGGAAAGPVKLPTAHPVAKIFGMLFIALFWNGIVSVFLWKMLQEWKSGGKPFGLTCFLVPFVLIGLGLIVGVFYTILGAFNPRPVLTLSAATIPLGGEATLSWTFTGAVSRMTGLKVTLEGVEEAKYRRGTKTYTDRETFATISVFESPGGVAASGSASVRVPAGTMHTFSGGNNRIVWTLKLSGTIPRWPDVTESVEVEVTPP
jgi:hypothetical protein